ncbi:hypothetical protein WG66_007052 [Moniliophthora roreri]|uniref:Nucleolus and neural progenitor protein-like N-terminal domain-containing protein n=1 Tax=Moniliophthora roreri TaxID=221103 RepID=A0A0W0F908_MONRR|nr:hypothetical protein WG66_007052 [Moniliophthora roreri]
MLASLSPNRTTYKAQRHERITLPADYHSIVDLVLKELKSCSKRLQVSLTAYDGELKILERIYYKGKNQHQSALFWKRIAEMRRYSRRVERLQLSTLLDEIRLTFFRESSTKLLKSPWTHYPDEGYIRATSGQLSLYSALLQKVHHKMQDIFRFNLLLSGAFVHLILTVLSVASRIGLLASELRSVVVDAKSTLFSLDAIYRPSSSATAELHLVDIEADRGSKESPFSAVYPPTIPRIVPVVTVRPSEVAEKSTTTREARPKKKKRNEIDEIFSM